MKRISIVVLIAALALVAPPTAGASVSGLEGVSCRLIGVPAAAPFGGAPCRGVQPGGLVLTAKGRCTLNFLFTDGAGRRYIGTAGHCILGDSLLAGQDVGERRWAEGTGPVARGAGGQRIGEFAYAVLQDSKDFALIRLDGNVGANAWTCHFGGPTGIDGSAGQVPVNLPHYGQGILLGSLLPARTMFALSTARRDVVAGIGLALPGDSGSPLLTPDGRALGLVVAVAPVIGPREVGTVVATRIAPQIARAAVVLGTSLRLQTARRF